METIGPIAGLLALALVIVWNVFQSRRIDALHKRIEALENK